MDNYKDDGGHAFPVTTENCVQGEWETGMTRRDYFAAKVLPACYAASVSEMNKSGYPDENWRIGIARDAFAMADAMVTVWEENQ